MKLKENFDHTRTGFKPAVLFARADSIYKQLDCDVWDQERDALRWPGGASIVAHPPCRSWGRLRKLAKPLLDATHVCGSPSRRASGYRPRKGDPRWRPELKKADMEATPAQFAVWLIEVARRCVS